MNKYISKILIAVFLFSTLSSAPTLAASPHIFDPTSVFHVLEAPAQRLKHGTKAVFDHVVANAAIYATVGLVVGVVAGAAFLINSPLARAEMIAFGKRLVSHVLNPAPKGGGVPGPGIDAPKAKDASSYSILAWIAGTCFKRNTKAPAVQIILDDESLEMILLAMEQIAAATVEDYNQLFFEAKASDVMPEAKVAFMRETLLQDISFEPADNGWFKIVNNRTGEHLIFSNRMPAAGELRGEILRARLETQRALNANQTLYEALLTLARTRDSEIYTYTKNALLHTHAQLTEPLLDGFAEKILQLMKQGRRPNLEDAKRIFRGSL